MLNVTPIQSPHGLGQEDPGDLIAAEFRKNFAERVTKDAPTYGLMGAAVGAIAVTGVSYAGLRLAGTKTPMKGSLAFGIGALVIGAFGVLHARAVIKQSITNPPEDPTATLAMPWFVWGSIMAT